MGLRDQRALVLSSEEMGLIHVYRGGGAVAVAAWAYERIDNALSTSQRAALVQQMGGREGQASVAGLARERR